MVRVGLSVPGPIDCERGLLLHPPNLPGWHGVEIRSWIASALGRPVRMENDANAAALAEWRFGGGQGARNLVYLTMSTGVGAGLILGGRLHRGHRGLAGELGHVPVEWGGEPCACGQRGCLEAYVGGAAWTQRLRRCTPESSRVREIAGAVCDVTPVHLVAAAREGDGFALRELERFNQYLGRGIVGLCFSLAPERVVLGTIPTAAGEALCLQPLRDLVAEQLWPEFAADLRILPAALGEELPFFAGVGVALDEVEEGAG